MPKTDPPVFIYTRDWVGCSHWPGATSPGRKQKDNEKTKNIIEKGAARAKNKTAV
jgi:hypothetical protein